MRTENDFQVQELHAKALAGLLREKVEELDATFAWLEKYPDAVQRNTLDNDPEGLNWCLDKDGKHVAWFKTLREAVEWGRENMP